MRSTRWYDVAHQRTPVGLFARHNGSDGMEIALNFLRTFQSSSPVSDGTREILPPLKICLSRSLTTTARTTSTEASRSSASTETTRTASVSRPLCHWNACRACSTSASLDSRTFTLWSTYRRSLVQKHISICRTGVSLCPLSNMPRHGRRM